MKPRPPGCMEKKPYKALLILWAFSGLGFSATVPVPFSQHSPVLLSIPSANVLLHGQYRLAGRFQYFTSSEIGSPDPDLVDSTEPTVKQEVQSLNYSSELLFGIENRAEFGVQYGQAFSLSIKALVLREDLLWPDLVFGVRNLFGSQEAGLYGVTNTKTKKNLQSESYVTAAKSFASRTRVHLGMSILTHATKGFGSLNAGFEQDLGAGANLGYEVFERFSDFHQVLSLQWKYRNLVALSLGMTEFQSWIRQGGRWGFFLTPSHTLEDGYNSPGISVSLQVLGWVPHRTKRTLPERVAILEVKNVQMERELSRIDDLKQLVLQLQADAKSGYSQSQRDSLLRDSTGGLNSEALKTPKEQAMGYLRSIAEKMQSDLSDPKESREAMRQLVGLGPSGIEVVVQTAGDSASGNRRVPAVLVMAFSKDTIYVKTLKFLCSDPDPQIRREALIALVKLSSKLALEDTKRLLSDPDETVAMAAGEAYRQLTGEVARPTPKTPPARKRGKPIRSEKS